MRFRLWFGILVTILAGGILGGLAAHASDASPTAAELEITLSTTESEAWEGERIVWQVSLRNVSDMVLSEVRLSPAGQTWLWPEGALTIGVLSAGDGTVVVVPVAALRSGEVWPTLLAEWTIGETEHSRLVTAGRSLLVYPVRQAVEGQVLLERGTVYQGEDLPLRVWIANRSPFPLTGVTLTGQGTDLKWESIHSGEDVQAGEIGTISLSPKVDGDNPQAILALEFHWIDAANRASNARLLLKSESALIKRRIPIDIPWSAVTAIIGFLLGWLTWWLQHRQERREGRQVNCERALGMLSLFQVQARDGTDNGKQVALDLLQKLYSEEGLWAAVGRLEQQTVGLKRCIGDIWRAAHEHNVGIHRPDGAERTKALRSKAKQLDTLLSHLKCKG